VGSDSSAGGYGRRRGFGRAAAVFAAVLVAALPAFAGGCGGSGHGAETDPEKGNDAAILNDALAKEMTLVSAYMRGQPLLSARQRASGRQLLAQEQEYVDGLTKAIRGLGGDVEAEAEMLDFSAVGEAKAFLGLAYRLESAALAYYVDSAAQLYTAAPRTLDASLSAGHSQHLVLLREALGARPAGAIPEGLERGETPPPGAGPAGEG
jgi:ferritin-like protein